MDSNCLKATYFSISFQCPYRTSISPFPSRYLFTIGYRRYLGLVGGSTIFKQDYISRSTRNTMPYSSIRDLLPSLASYVLDENQHSIKGLFHVRSPLLTESRLISIPLVTKMFQFTKSLMIIYMKTFIQIIIFL